MTSSTAGNTNSRVDQTPTDRTDCLVDEPSNDRFHTCIHELFEAQVRRTPEALAVVLPGQTLTYQDLDRRADVLAGALRCAGVGPEVLVGVYLEKSPAWIVAILAVLKAGGAYVPLDPAAPLQRLAQVPLRIVVTGRAWVSRATRIGADVIVSDDISPVEYRPEPSFPRCHPGNLAYVIYTSGSTGAAKGVAVEHRSLVRSTLARWSVYQAPQAFLLLSAAAFDSAVAGLFGTLTRGGAVHLPGAGRDADVEMVIRMIESHGIDALLTLPAMYELLLRVASPCQLESLRTVVVAGERCPATLPARSRAVVPNADFFNEYGPTEATVWATVWRAPRTGTGTLSSVPIGQAIDGIRTDIVDAEGDMVVDGMPGELCLAGPNLARGYLGRPGLTAASFEPDPGGAAGARRYRTGDLVRRLRNFDLEFLGRIDRQVKVRGYRVEPGEIEDALRSLPGVHEAAVVARPHHGSQALAAFLAGPAVDVRSVCTALVDLLPAYMIPTEFHVVDRLPLTSSGKVHVPALQEMSAVSPFVDTHYGSPVEHAVARVWCQVLNRDTVDPNESFLELGGSLDVVRISLRLSELFGTKVPLFWVYETRTVADLARWVENECHDASARAHAWLSRFTDAQSDIAGKVT